MKLLVCGTKKKLSMEKKDEIRNQIRHSIFPMNIDTIIEGCCKDSPDILAEDVAREKAIKIMHFPANSGNYLKRNYEMVASCDIVLAFWDGWSYGTAHTIAAAVLAGKKVRVYKI